MKRVSQRGRVSSARPRRVPRNRRRPNYLLLFCIFVLVTTVVGSVTFIFTTPKLHIAKLEIKGVHLADASAIDKAAAHAVGQNIILLRTRPILKEVGRLNEVRLVKIGRRLPNQMWLRVWERKADAVLVTGSGCYLVQSDGFVFHRVPKPVKGIPIVQVAGDTKIMPGKMAASPSIKCALQILAIARQKAIKLGEISVDPRGDICLNMDSDFCAKLGQPDDIALKMSLLRNALANRPSIVRDGDYIDLSCPSAPVWKRKVASQTAS